MSKLGSFKPSNQYGVFEIYVFRLIYRMVFFVSAIAAYIYAKIRPEEPGLMSNSVINRIVWLICLYGVIRRFFPSEYESRGCEKVFAKYYKPRDDKNLDKNINKIINKHINKNVEKNYKNIIEKNSKKNIDKSYLNRGVILSFIFWIFLNSVFGILYKTGIIDTGAMILLCSFYSVCDYICILFYCPFRSIFLKNRCCVTCRIFHWDYAMIFTPLAFVPGVDFKLLLFFSLLLVARWEITCYLHPERFLEETNQFLSCAGCTEKLCRIRRRIRS